MAAPAPDNSSLTTEPRKERLQIVHMLVWTATTAVVLGLDRATSEPSNGELGAWPLIFGLSYGPLVGAGVAAWLLMFWRIWTEGPRFPSQPGHWLLLLAGTSGVMQLLVRAMLALSAAGGVGAAAETVQIARTHAAEQQARQAFSTPSPTGQAVITVSGSSIAPMRIPSSPRLGLPEQPRAPLKEAERLSTSRQGEAFIAPPPPRADSRATSYGLGVPLRPRVGPAVESRIDTVRAAPPLKAKTATGAPPVSVDPTDAPWIALPNQDKGRSLASKERQLARPARSCGCSGTCHHRRRR